VAVGVSATALAFALGRGPVPPPKPLAQAVHDALGGEAVQGVSANITLTNHLLEGANLAGGEGQGGGGLSSSPLVNGGSGRLWIADGKLRIELQTERGDTQILYDGHTVSMYDAATNTLYRYVPKDEATEGPAGPAGGGDHHEAPSVARIEEAISHLREHVDVSGAKPTDVAGQAAYTVRVSPKESGSLLGGAELTFDAAHGIPLRAAVYSSTSSSPVIELAATEVGYGPIEGSVFAFTPPANAKVEELSAPAHPGPPAAGKRHRSGHANVTTRGHGAAAIAILQAKAKAGTGGQSSSSLERLPKVDINGTSASELRTALGTILTFERSGVRYVLAGSVDAAAIEAVARSL
jgi:outer membrane lipoprotein-sorting protein